MKKILISFLFLFIFYSSAFSEGQIKHDRFNVFYVEADSLLKEGKYKEAFDTGVEYIDRSSLYGCKGYELLSQINTKQSFPTDQLNQLLGLCKKVQLMTLTNSEVQILKQELESKQSFDVFDVMKIHLVTMGRFTKFGNSPKDEADYKDIFKKLEAYKEPLLSITKDLTLFFHYSFLGEIDKKMRLVPFLDKEDFFYKPVFLIYVMYTKGRTIEGYKKVINYENISRLTSTYESTYKNMSWKYFYEEKNYTDYLDALSNYRKFSSDREKENIGIWSMDQNKELIKQGDNVLEEKLTAIFGGDYVNFIKGHLFLSQTGSLESSSLSGSIFLGITPDTAFLNILSYYDKNKQAIQNAQKLIDPSNSKGLQELGIKVSTGGLNDIDIIGTQFIPRVFRTLYFNDKDGLRPLPESFFEKVARYQSSIVGLDLDSFTDKDRPYSLSGITFPNSSSDQVVQTMTGIQSDDKIVNTTKKSFRYVYMIFFLSIFSFLILSIIYIKQIGGNPISKKN